MELVAIHVDQFINVIHCIIILASFPGLLTPVFVACSTSALVLQATNACVRPRNEAMQYHLNLHSYNKMF